MMGCNSELSLYENSIIVRERGLKKGLEEAWLDF